MLKLDIDEIFLDVLGLKINRIIISVDYICSFILCYCYIYMYVMNVSFGIVLVFWILILEWYLE